MKSSNASPAVTRSNTTGRYHRARMTTNTAKSNREARRDRRERLARRTLRALRLAIVFGCVATVVASDSLPQDRGGRGTWQKLLKLRTIASVMHTTAHPDDEHGGLLAMLSRGEGARLSLLTLNRGEAGDNAIGSELVDAPGLIRAAEGFRADQYSGADRPYFTTAIGYGVSNATATAL